MTGVQTYLQQCHSLAHQPLDHEDSLKNKGIFLLKKPTIYCVYIYYKASYRTKIDKYYKYICVLLTLLT